jgi:hypothetical protein
MIFMQICIVKYYMCIFDFQRLSGSDWKLQNNSILHGEFSMVSLFVQTFIKLNNFLTSGLVA